MTLALSAKPIPIKGLLTTALNWIEDQIQPGRGIPPADLQRKLRECQPIAAIAHLQLEQQKTVNIRGPVGIYPIALGLSLISATSGKPWSFSATPASWSDEDWLKLTDAVEYLHEQPIQYTTGYKQLHIVGDRNE